jgi:hypothetical protein
MSAPELPPIPQLPPWNNVRMFVLGGLWCLSGAASAAASAAFGIVLSDWNHNDPTNWHQVWDVSWSAAAPMAGIALVAYYQKYKALLTPPPGTELVKTTTTTTTALPTRPPSTVAVATETVEVKPIAEPPKGAGN